MTGIGGDAFWLIHDGASGEVHALNGSGRSVRQATRARYRDGGHRVIPQRGPLACVTVPGAVDSWCAAHDRFGRLPLADDLAQAVSYARDGYPVSAGQARFTAATTDVLRAHALTARTFLPDGAVPEVGSLMRFPRLADTLERVAEDGRSAFYEGAVAEEIVRALAEAGGYWEREDLASHESGWDRALSTTYRDRRLHTHPPNSQGFVHLMIMNILECFELSGLDPCGPQYVHLVVEATKLAFVDRDRYLTDPGHVQIPMQRLLSREYAAGLAARIRPDRAGPVEARPQGADTTCTVVVDRWGTAVSVIQSLYHEFGSGIVAGDSGVLLQNRGSFFSLEDDHVNCLEPGKRTFHTLMPAMMTGDAGLDLVYGTMGGEGQPQTSTALATRHVDFGLGVQDLLDQPRWLYGRTWGEDSRSLRVESRFGSTTVSALADLGHQVETVDAWSDLAGHAAAIAVDPGTGVLVGGADARSDGIAAGW
jgi:gamma-glutamyltranspeptidase